MIRTSKFKRLMSGVLAVIMAVSLLPSGIISASAADVASTIYPNTSATIFEKKYTSDVLGEVILRNFYFTSDGVSVPGFCNDHAKPLWKSSSGYVDPVLYATNSVATPLLDAYMAQWTRSLKIAEESGYFSGTGVPTKEQDRQIEEWIAAHPETGYNENSYYSEFERQIYCAATQAAVWLYANGKLTDSATLEEKATIIGTERYKALYAMGYTAVTLDGCIEFVRDTYENWEKGYYEPYEYYVYTPVENKLSVQPILIPKIVHDYSGYIKLKKVDENGQPLAGAIFGIYTEEACIHKIDSITTTADEWNYSGKIDLNGKSQTLWVKEISAPGDYIPNAKPWPVTVDSTTNNTKETAAAVRDGTAIKNVKDTPDGVVYKVDSNGNTIGPVSFKFYSIEHNTDSIKSSDSGVIELQWIDPAKDNYIEPGEYRVTEEEAPPGYVKSDEAQNIKFWVEYDDEGLPILMNSGPLHFTNELMRKVKVKKVDGSGNPLAGANFDIYKDGTKIGSDTTEKDGSFTYAGEDGNGLESGYYEFVETSAPGGYLVPTNNKLSVTIDTSDPSQPEVIELGPLVNYEYPEIRIRKLINGTDTGLVGAVFQVRIDGKMLDEVFLFIECRPKKMIGREIFS